jgi:RNA polymerase sigma factor (sigma-70 family)
MAEKLETHNRGTEPHRVGADISAFNVRDWFLREVFPLEGVLMQFLHQNWRNKNDIEDLRQDVYMRVYEAAQKEIPEKAKPFILKTARNLLVDRVRREHVVPIEAVADLDALGAAIEAPGPERSAIARDMLRRLQAALDRLPPRCREAVVLKQIEGLSRREIAERMDISQDTVSEHLTVGIRALAEMLYGESEMRGGL